MARYKLHMKSFLQSARDMVGVIHEEGSEITVGPECPPGPHWEPLDDEAREIVKKYADNPELLKPRKLEEMPLHAFTPAPGGIAIKQKSRPVADAEAIEPPASKVKAVKAKRAYHRKAKAVVAPEATV